MLVNQQEVYKPILQALRQLALKPNGQLIEYPDGRVYRNDELVAEKPTEEQLEWYQRRMRGPARSWER